MMKVFLHFSCFFFLIHVFPAFAKAAEDMPVFSETHRRVLHEIDQTLQHNHYRKLSIDDAFSSRLLDELLKNLDGNRLFFLASDIADFEDSRHHLDDAIHKADLKRVEAIFQRYRERGLARLQQEMQQLDDRVKGFDFQMQESVLLDRSQADWPTDQAEADELWRLNIKAMAIDLLLAGKSREQIVELLGKRLQSQLDGLQRLNSNDFFDIFTNTLGGLYDPHTNYLSPARSEQFAISMRLSLEGIGATLRQDNHHTRIVSLVPGGPASKQGELQPLDRVTGVAQGDDGLMQDVIGWRLDDVVALIRGAKGTVVRLEVIPATASSEAERRLIRIVRDKVKLEEQAARGTTLDIPLGEQPSRRVAVVQLPAFYVDFEAMARGDNDYRSTTRDVRALIEQLQQDPAVEGLVLDLRNNGGGSLLEANDLTSLFIDYGPIVQIRTGGNRIGRESRSPFSSLPVYRMPLVILVNRLSASASEIVAAALQDYGRAVIVGSPSFGKGTVQNLSELSAGQLKLTISKFYRISGGSTQHRGVEPDIHLPSLFNDRDIGESSQDNALPWDSIAPLRHGAYYPMPRILPVLRERHDARLASDAEFQWIRERLVWPTEQDRQHIDLEENRRRAQLDAWRAEALSLSNAQRKAQGLPLREVDAVPLTEEERLEEALAEQAAQQQDPRSDEVLLADRYLVEAARVLLDLVDVLQQQGFQPAIKPKR